MANFYVRPDGGSYGTEDGSSWTNAYDGLQDITWASVNAGYTIWVAGGTYTSDLLPPSGKSGSAGNVIAIRRARANAVACTGAAGWSAGFDSLITQNDKGIFPVANSYITFSGATTVADEIGWYMHNPGSTGEGGAITPFSPCDHLSFECMELEGPGYVVYSGDSRGIDLTRSNGGNNFSFVNFKIHRFTTGIYLAGSGISATTFQGIEMYDCSAVNSASFHPNGIIMINASDITITRCSFHKGPDGWTCGEGIFTEQTGGCSDIKIYNNKFYDLDITGSKGIEISATTNGLKVIGNTFDNCISPFLTQVAAGTSTETKNNIFSRGGSGISYGTTSNNLETSTDVFVNRAAANFNIISTVSSGYPRSAGATLSSPYDVDFTGATRTVPFDIGAYAYQAGSGGNITCAALSATSLTIG